MRDLLDSVAAVYEAVLEPERWPEALDKVAAACEGHSAILSFDDNQHGITLNGAFNQLSTSYAPKEAAEYLARFGEFELTGVRGIFETVSQRPIHAAITDLEAYGFENLDALARHPATAEVKRRFGFFRRAGCVLNPYEPWRDALLLQFPERMAEFPPQAFDKLALIAPYVARAIVTARPLAMLRARYNLILEVLDRLAVGTAILDPRGQIVIHNRAFDRLLDENPLLLRDRAGILRARDDALARDLRAAIEKAVRTGSGEPSGPGTRLFARGGHGKPPACLDISPLGRLEGSGSTSGYAIVFAVDPQWRLVVDPGPLARAYDLTDSEERTCRHLLEGLTNAEIAELRSLRPNTVKSQVASVLSKTHTRNRTELAHRASSAVIPLLDE